jgi:hypothetical protein
MIEAQDIAARLGPRQREVILSLRHEAWGRASSHRVAKALWWRGGPRLVDHKYRTDNCWALTPFGAKVKAVVEALA